jgi:hypothetical protein
MAHLKNQRSSLQTKTDIAQKACSIPNGLMVKNIADNV